jgi:hypothetical protein
MQEENSGEVLEHVAARMACPCPIIWQSKLPEMATLLVLHFTPEPQNSRAYRLPDAIPLWQPYGRFLKY